MSSGMIDTAVLSNDATCSDEAAAKVMRREAIAGLQQVQKTLPCKYFYDQRGSELFDEICELPEYYLTRTELQIMREEAAAMADVIGPQALLVEYGSGSSLKTRILLDHLRSPAGYVPIDISRDHLLRTARGLRAAYPEVPIHPVCADYTRPFDLPEIAGNPPRQVVAYFPGSTIGNFTPIEATAFLRSMRATCGPGSGLLIGTDLKKDPAILHAAYNDSAGVTAEFNLNILRHLNNAIGSDFDLESFDHYAFFDPRASRMQMHLISHRAQRVQMGNGVTINFAEGESIHTESCHKFTRDGFKSFAEGSGYRRKTLWTDPKGWFAVQYLVATPDGNPL